MLKEKLNKFYLRGIDLLIIFVYGFAFFIMAFDAKLGLGYFFFCVVASLILMGVNYSNES